MEAEAGFTPLLIVIALAFAVPLVLMRFQRLRLPIVVGAILAGVRRRPQRVRLGDQ